MADREWRAVAGADDQVLIPLEHDRQRERTFQLLQRLERCIDRSGAALHLPRNQMRDDFGVRL